jgi:hypothetical protein
VRFVRRVKFSCAASWDARGGHASPHIPPDDAALSGLPETVVEPGDGDWAAGGEDRRITPMHRYQTERRGDRRSTPEEVCT